MLESKWSMFVVFCAALSFLMGGIAGPITVFVLFGLFYIIQNHDRLRFSSKPDKVDVSSYEYFLDCCYTEFRNRREKGMVGSFFNQIKEEMGNPMATDKEMAEYLAKKRYRAYHKKVERLYRQRGKRYEWKDVE